MLRKGCDGILLTIVHESIPIALLFLYKYIIKTRKIFFSKKDTARFDPWTLTLTPMIYIIIRTEYGHFYMAAVVSAPSGEVKN